MLKRKHLLSLTALLLALVAVVGMALAQDGTVLNWTVEDPDATAEFAARPAAPQATTVRFAHLAPFASNIDDTSVVLKVDGVVLKGNFKYGDDTAYMPLSTGNHQVQILQGSNPVVDQSVTLADGPQSVVFIGGNVAQIPFALWLLSDAAAPPAPGTANVRVAHAAPIGTTIDATRVDYCSQDGIPLNGTSQNLRYLRASEYRPNLAAGTYDTKVTRYIAMDQPCAGSVVGDIPPITFSAGQNVTVYLVGDGTKQPVSAFIFGQGLIKPPPVGKNKVYLPNVLR